MRNPVEDVAAVRFNDPVKHGVVACQREAIPYFLVSIVSMGEVQPKAWK